MLGRGAWSVRKLSGLFKYEWGCQRLFGHSSAGNYFKSNLQFKVDHVLPKIKIFLYVGCN